MAIRWVGGLVYTFLLSGTDNRVQLVFLKEAALTGLGNIG